MNERATRKEVFFDSGLGVQNMTDGKEYEIEEIAYLNPLNLGRKMLYQLRNDVGKTVFLSAVLFSPATKPLMYESDENRWSTKWDGGWPVELWDVPDIRKIFWEMVNNKEIPAPQKKVTFADFSIDANHMNPEEAMKAWNNILKLADIRPIRVRNAVLSDAKRNVKKLVQSAEWMKNSIDQLQDYYTDGGDDE